MDSFNVDNLPRTLVLHNRLEGHSLLQYVSKLILKFFLVGYKFYFPVANYLLQAVFYNDTCFAVIFFLYTQASST